MDCQSNIDSNGSFHFHPNKESNFCTYCQSINDANICTHCDANIESNCFTHSFAIIEFNSCTHNGFPNVLQGTSGHIHHYLTKFVALKPHHLAVGKLGPTQKPTGNPSSSS
jgi:hypothetical protein